MSMSMGMGMGDATTQEAPAGMAVVQEDSEWWFGQDMELYDPDEGRAGS
jgi:hypothetical protein